MADPIPIPSPIPPELRVVLDSFRKEVFYNLHCVLPAKIVSFDAAKQTASVQVSILKAVGGSQVAYPVMTDCPVFVLAGGEGAVTVPVTAGDTCLVVFCDRDIDTWFSTGNATLPNSGRAHDLSDGFVLVGVRNLTNPLANYSTTDAQLRNKAGTGGVSVGENSKVNVFSATETLQNAMSSLMDQLDGLCTVLTSWVNTGGSTPNPATVTAINGVKSALSDVKTQFNNVLKS